METSFSCTDILSALFKREISLRLKKFFKLYDNTYTDEQILTAAKNYVETFNGQYNYMRVLKYFIWKDEKKLTEDEKIQVVEISDLANYIENANNNKLMPSINPEQHFCSSSYKPDKMFLNTK